MASYGKFQSDNAKYTKKSSRVNKYNPDFTPQVDVIGKNMSNTFNANLSKWSDLVAYLRWYPDIFFDLIRPETGGIRLDLDQRVLLRAMARFDGTYGVFSRGYGKSMIIVMSQIHACIFYPGVQLTVTAQTKETSAKILNEKYDELLRFYPLLKEEIYSSRFQKELAEITFHNGSTIKSLANAQSSKGMRKHQGVLDEDNLTNEEVFLDVLKPIFNIPRRTLGKKGLIDPYEGNGKINFFTSAGYKGSSAYYRCLNMHKGMLNLDGSFCIGAGWKLPMYYGRGEALAKILKKKEEETAVAFDQNYNARWTGSSDRPLVNINKLLSCRNISTPELKCNGKDKYILCVDVARSEKNNNCQTVIGVLKVVNNKNGRIKELSLVNLESVEGRFDFDAQAIEIKRFQIKYDVCAIVIDDNGLGKGVADAIVKEHRDPITGEILDGYATINSERISETENAKRIVYCYLAQSNDSDAIPIFMSYVDTEKIRLLERKTNMNFTLEEDNNVELKLPFIQTDFFIDEVSNLKLKTLNNGKLTVEKLVAKVPKDRYSAVLYGTWYAVTFMNEAVSKDTRSDLEFLSSFAHFY